MKNGGAHSDQRRGQDDHPEASGKGENRQSAQGQAHSPGERKRLRPPIGIETNAWLEDRSRHLKGESDEADLHETQVETRFEQGVNRRNERLDRVIEQVRKT